MVVVRALAFAASALTVMAMNFDDPVLTMKKPIHSKNSGGGEYVIGNNPGRVFDGIGGLSGGGATSRLLVNYPPEYRDQILDFLFRPNFGASLQILKVEIGGDAQSTDGTEPSHMHSETETPDFTRGYEWWVMTEAKKRNPDIRLAALSWAWPGWIGDGTAWPYQNYTKISNYIISWINGAKSQHNLTINYIGIWNERPYDVGYIKFLRKELDSHGLNGVRIVAADKNWEIAKDILQDIELNAAVDIIGAHYPGTKSSSDAEKTGKTLWASEDYSTFNDNVGAGCWARTLNQNYVNGNITASIAWNLIASYYDKLPYKRCSLMTANEPWSGHYEVPNVIWVTAHTTQFTFPGWRYVNSGHLEHGGSYVALTDPKSVMLTIILETMSHDNSECIRPSLPRYSVEAQNVTLVLNGAFRQIITKLFVWTTYLGQSPSDDQVFAKSMVNIVDGKVSLYMEPDKMVTLTTLEAGQKGSYPTPPPSKPFPLPYQDHFDEHDEFSEAPNFADQAGVFELFENQSSADGHQRTMRQAVTMRPITSCDDSTSPITIIGNYSWSDVNVTVDVKLENASAVFVAARVDSGGCNVINSKGLFLWLQPDMSVILTTTLRNLNSMEYHQKFGSWFDPSVDPSSWNRLSIAIQGSVVHGYLNSNLLFKKDVGHLDVPENGWAAFGVKTFSHAQFDNFSVKKPE